MIFSESRVYGQSALRLSVVLAPRELSISRLVAGAFTNREIAKKLGIAENTVQWNLHRLYQGLGLRGRMELGFWWRDHQEACNSRGPVEVEHWEGCPCAWCAPAA